MRNHQLASTNFGFGAARDDLRCSRINQQRERDQRRLSTIRNVGQLESTRRLIELPNTDLAGNRFWIRARRFEERLGGRSIGTQDRETFVVPIFAGGVVVPNRAGGPMFRQLTLMRTKINVGAG